MQAIKLIVGADVEQYRLDAVGRLGSHTPAVVNSVVLNISTRR